MTSQRGSKVINTRAQSTPPRTYCQSLTLTLPKQTSEIEQLVDVTLYVSFLRKVMCVERMYKRTIQGSYIMTDQVVKQLLSRWHETQDHGCFSDCKVEDISHLSWRNLFPFPMNKPRMR